MILYINFLLSANNPIVEISNKFGVQWPLLIAQTINFCIMGAIVYFLAFKPILKILDTRQKKIADGLQYAEEMRLQLEETAQKKHETIQMAVKEAKKIIDNAQDESKAYLDRQRQDANKISETMISKTQEMLNYERSKMLSEVRSNVVDLVVETTKHVLRKELSDKEQSEFTKTAIQELEKVETK